MNNFIRLSSEVLDIFCPSFSPPLHPIKYFKEALNAYFTSRPSSVFFFSFISWCNLPNGVSALTVAVFAETGGLKKKLKEMKWNENKDKLNEKTK